MRWKSMKSVLLGGLAFTMAIQPIMTYGFAVSIPSKVVNVKYPEEFQAKIYEVLACVEEAEQELYNQKTLKGIPKIKHKETRSCRDILKTKDFAEDITFSVDYSKTTEQSESRSLKTNSSVLENKLTILDKPLELDGDSPYLEDTETLEIAMRLFIELNEDLYGDIAGSHKEEDLLDVLYLRIFNLTYSLPKAQRHPIFTEFMRDVRDSYFRVSTSEFFQALLYYAWRTNPDKELEETLYRFVLQMEIAANPMDSVPDEDLPLKSDQEDMTPAVPDPDENGFGDIDGVWEESYKPIKEKEEKENEDVVVQRPGTPSNYRTVKNYEVQNDVCVKVITEYKDGDIVEEYSEKATASETYRCGSLSLVVPGSVNDEDNLSEEDLDFSVYYQYGSEESEWALTLTKAVDNELEYDFLVDLLMTVTTNHGNGFLQDQTRALFIFEGQPFYLKTYEGILTLDEINAWLLEEGVPLRFGTNKDESKNGESLPDNFADLIVNPTEGLEE